ncbi:MAG: hypothetical protein ACRYFX_07885 [Janthinobacterium lividum]
MNLNLFAPENTVRNQQLLNDAIWKLTDYYLLDSRSERWQWASYVTLDKRVARSPAAAVVYLLQRLAIEVEGWNEKNQLNWKAAEFAMFIFSTNYVASRESWEITPAKCWENLGWYS